MHSSSSKTNGRPGSEAQQSSLPREADLVFQGNGPRCGPCCPERRRRWCLHLFQGLHRGILSVKGQRGPRRAAHGEGEGTPLPSHDLTPSYEEAKPSQGRGGQPPGPQPLAQRVVAAPRLDWAPGKGAETGQRSPYKCSVQCPQAPHSTLRCLRCCCHSWLPRGLWGPGGEKLPSGLVRSPSFHPETMALHLPPGQTEWRLFLRAGAQPSQPLCVLGSPRTPARSRVAPHHPDCSDHPLEEKGGLRGCQGRMRLH